MREIKFRYWNPFIGDNGEMVRNPMMPHKDGWTVEQLFSDRGWIWMQYIGLSDKRGQDIYEGDIINFKKDGGAIEFTGIVKFSDGAFWIQAMINKVCIHFYSKVCEIEVIGNIYENQID